VSTDRWSIAVDEYLPHPPERVWHALTDSDQLAAWLMPNDFIPAVGHCFTLDAGNWGPTKCEVLAIERHRLIRFSWHNGPLDTEVVWRLEPEGAGTRFVVEHHGFDPDQPIQRFAFDRMREGWASTAIAGLRAVLDDVRHRDPQPRPRNRELRPHG
jgi:uncharacterized protein YndB with AHSA1/START domain